MKKAKLGIVTTLAAAAVSLGLAIPASATSIVQCDSCGGSNIVNGCDISTKWLTTRPQNIRRQPNLSGGIIGTVPTGACLRSSDYSVDSRGVGWIYTTHRGKSGWVSTMYLR
jgi:hypothetical protein